ncbi:MAG: UDP-N-acetylglucosamine 2-epimerase [bacterium]|nr:UDP-N-acetylglucosamine 2-epimerase [bacterium]
MKTKKRKIAVIAGSRGEYGYFRPIIKEIIKRPNLDYGIIATNMHVLDSFGSTVDEIKKDRFKIHATLYNTFDGYNHLTMVKSLAVFKMQLPEMLEQMGADMLLLAGDRGEQLMAAIVGAYMYIPTAHIQAGEVSGNIDGVARHAITKLVHLHFAANEDAARRVIRLGEEKFRVFNVGAPQLDELLSVSEITPKKELYKKLELDSEKPVLIVVQHPVTEEFDEAERQMEETMKAVMKFSIPIVIIMGNSDAGSRVMRNVITRYRQPNVKIFPSIIRKDYSGLLNIAGAIIGNSSSGILEAPSFGLPAVNIGNRQKGRVQAKNVINAGYSASEIEKAITKALSEKFREKIKNCGNPYGDGKSSKRIVDILENIPIDDKLLIKKITY